MDKHEREEGFLKVTAPDRHMVRIGDCPRCGEDHDEVLIQRMPLPREGYTWWGYCPTTHAPILIESYQIPSGREPDAAP